MIRRPSTRFSWVYLWTCAIYLSTFSPIIAQETSSRLWVEIRDGEGNPTAARISVTGPDGESLAPEASLVRGNREQFFHARGHFQLLAPIGEVTIKAVKGFEYYPVTEQVDLNYLELQDRTTVATVTLERMIDMPALGWYSGDVHMHPNHREGDLYVTLEDTLLLSEGEDIRVANLLISNRQGTPRVFDTEFFNDGKPDPLSNEHTLMVVQEEFRNASGMYGHMPMLGIKRLITPFFTGRVPHWEDYPPNYTIASQAQDQGGVVSYAHPSTGPGIPEGLHVAREFPIDLALGVVNALDLLSNMDEEGGMWMYYRVLNSGLRCTASAGTDTQMDVLDRDSLPGGSKVYVKVDGPLTYEKWIEGYRAGRTFVTNGPLLFLDLEGEEPGGELPLQSPRNLKAAVRAQSLSPMERLQLIVNGEVVAETVPEGDDLNLTLEHTLDIEESAWVAARVLGERSELVRNDRQLFAHTSPIYVSLQGRPVVVEEDVRIVLEWIDRLIADVRESPRFSQELQRREVLEIFERGRQYYEDLLD